MNPEDFKKINWLASYPKSGNTWVRMLMDAYFYGEVDINDVISSVGDSREEFYQLDSLSPLRYPLHIQQMIRPSALIKMVMQFNQRSFNDCPLFLKTHNVNAELHGVELIPSLLTRNVIYLVRDPRDVAPSFAAHMGIDHDTAVDRMTSDFGGLSSEKNTVQEFTSSWGKNLRSYIGEPAKGVGIFRYEDLKANTAETFANMLRHIGLEPEPEKVENAVKSCELSKLQQQEEQTGFIEKSPKTEKFFGGKHRKLSAKNRKRLETAFSREMQQLGYL